MRTSTSLRWLVVAVSAAMLLTIAAACGDTKTIEVPGETVIVEKEVVKTVEVPGETVVKEVVKEVQVPGETVVVEKVVTETVEVPGETVVVEKEVVKTVEVPGETVTVEVVKEVQVPGETVVVEKVVTQTVQVPGETVVVEKVVVKTVEVPGQTVVVEKEVIKTVAGPERVVVKVEEVVGEKYTRNVWGELVAKPQYGGTIPLATGWNFSGFDPYDNDSSNNPLSLVLEKLGIADWATPRDEFDFTTAYVPMSYIKPHLAESWEQPDPLTTIFHIRKGVTWHDKAPMNGRELTAYDVEFSFHRIMGLGSGYTEPSPYAAALGNLPVESVMATDKWTVVVKASSFSIDILDNMLIIEEFGNFIQPREVIEQYGDLKDWRHLVGTGPYELTDYVSASFYEYTKNPNYWLTDERYPGYQLPFADEIELLVMPDLTTRLAALRSGKIANMTEEFWPLDQVASLQRTNPELLLVNRVGRATAVGLLVSEPPFSDIRVRKAMQKAINLEEIANTYYLGNADPTPSGPLSKAVKGYYIPFDEWPEEVKEGYRYDPDAAEKLLDQAGYRRGSDGIRFKTKYDMDPAWMDIDLGQIAKAYWAEIGVDVELNILEGGQLWDRVTAKTYEHMTMAETRHNSFSPLPLLDYAAASTNEWQSFGIDDRTFDELLVKATASTDREEITNYVRQADLRFSEMQWNLFLPVVPAFAFIQPWLHGYNGEYAMGGGTHFLQYSRSWIDHEFKKEMGH